MTLLLSKCFVVLCAPAVWHVPSSKALFIIPFFLTSDNCPPLYSAIFRQ